MSAGLNIKVDEGLIEPIIAAQIESAIVAQLGKHDERIIAEIVRGVLTQKVGDDGKKSEYSYHNNRTFIEWLVQDAIRHAAMDAIKAYVSQNEAALRAEVERQFKTSTKSLAKLFVSGLTDAISQQWRFNLDIKFDTPRDT